MQETIGKRKRAARLPGDGCSFHRPARELLVAARFAAPGQHVRTGQRLPPAENGDADRMQSPPYMPQKKSQLRHSHGPITPKQPPRGIAGGWATRCRSSHDEDAASFLARSDIHLDTWLRHGEGGLNGPPQLARWLNVADQPATAQVACRGWPRVRRDQTQSPSRMTSSVKGFVFLGEQAYRRHLSSSHGQVPCISQGEV